MLLGHAESVVDLDPEAPHGALELPVSEQKPTGARQSVDALRALSAAFARA
jgi:hypothetical protein